MEKSKKRVTMKKNARRMLVFGFFSLTIIAVVMITVANVVGEILAKYKEAEELEQKKIVLQEQEEKLNNEINKLQDAKYLASYARERYFYSKEGELIIRLPVNNE